jgi:hypothetical protein
MTEPTTFERWCILNGTRPVPATPMMVARFVADVAPWGVDKIWPIVQEISRAHYTVGLADPTLGGPVAAAINEIAKIDPPRSWNKEEKQRFNSLPYDLQKTVVRREDQREKTVRRAMQEASDARAALKALQQPKVTDGTEADAA